MREQSIFMWQWLAGKLADREPRSVARREDEQVVLQQRVGPEHEATAQIIVGFASVLAVVSPSGLLLRWWVGEVDPTAATIVILCSLVYAVIPWLLRTTGSLMLAGVLLNLSLGVLILTSGWYAGGIGGPVMAIAPLLPLVATFLLGGRAGLVMIGLLMAALGVLFGVDYAGVELPRPLLSEDQELIARALFLAITIGLTGFFANVYHRRRTATEEQLRQSRDLYQRLFDQSKETVALTTYDGHLVDINPAGVELFGFGSKQELLGRDVAGLYVDSGRRGKLLEQLEREGYVRDYESQIRKRSGDVRIVQGTTSTIRGDSGAVEYLLAILHDVTERRRAESEREAMVAELASKNKDLRQFTHTVSHDLKAPLITIGGFIGALRQDLAAERLDRLPRYGEIIASAAGKMGNIIDGLLELSEIGRGELSRRTTSLDQVAQQAISLLAERIATAGATVRVASDLPTVEGDPALLLTVLQNLIDNGVKYSSGSETPEVLVGWRQEDRGVILTVADNGIGIDPKDQQRIFDPFHQLRPDQEGSGIGLASVRRAVEAHGGRIWVESEGKGEGTTFCFTVPSS